MKRFRRYGIKLVVATSIVSYLLFPIAANASTLSSGSVALGSTRVSATSTTYTFTWSSVTTSAIKCIKVSFNTAADGSGSKPTGMTITSATHVTGSSNYLPWGQTWTDTNNNSTGVTTITNATGETPASASARTLQLNTITNPSTADTTYYALFNTYNNVDCSTSPVDNGVVTFSVTAGRLTTASMGISDPRPLQSGVTYTFTASGVSLTAIKCVKVRFATTATGSTAPSGMSTAGAGDGSTTHLDATSNYIPSPDTNWVTDGTTNGTIKATYTTGDTPASASSRTVVMTGVTNGDTAETGYFAQFNTYANTDCSTSPVDTTTIEFVYENGQNVSVDVDPSLTFTATPRVNADPGGGVPYGKCNGATLSATAWTGSNVNLGNVTAATDAIAGVNLKIWTNATNGFTVFTRYDHTLYNQSAPTPSAVTISDASGTNASPSSMATGTEGFGYTTDDQSLGTGTVDRFTNGGPTWAKFSTTNAEVAYHGAPSGSSTDIGSYSSNYAGGTSSNGYVCLAYRVDIAGTTEAGHYTDTVFLTATPIY